MSKAFTKEDVPEPPLARPQVRLAVGEKRYVTSDGHAALEAQLRSWKAAADPRAPGLEHLLAVLTVVPGRTETNKVYFGAWVDLEGEEGPRTVRIVGPDETHLGEHFISVDSPLARALIGLAPGDSVEVRTPGGRREVTVVSLRYHPRAPQAAPD